MDTARAMPWLYSLASEFFCSCVFYSDCCSNPVSQVKDFPGVPEREAGDGYGAPCCGPESEATTRSQSQQVPSTQLIAIPRESVRPEKPLKEKTRRLESIDG